MLDILTWHASSLAAGLRRSPRGKTKRTYSLSHAVLLSLSHKRLKAFSLMELRSIQYFVQVADEGSITRTADKIGIAQPALTRHIKQLEAELGTQLLTRLPRGVRLTTSGRDFLDHARAITLEVSRASEHVRAKAQAPHGKVVMGTSPTLAPLLLPGCVARARQQCPAVTLQVVEGFSPQLLDALV